MKPRTTALTVMASTHAAVLYDALPAADPGELTGLYRARLVHLPALDRVGARAGRRLLRVINAVVAIGYRGKAFDATSGVNVWFGVLRFARFTVHPATTRTGGAGTCLQIDYDLPANPRRLRALRSEIRRVEPGLYLCPMYPRLDRDEPLLWFTLEAVR